MQPYGSTCRWQRQFRASCGGVCCTTCLHLVDYMLSELQRPRQPQASLRCHPPCPTGRCEKGGEGEALQPRRWGRHRGCRRSCRHTRGPAVVPRWAGLHLRPHPSAIRLRRACRPGEIARGWATWRWIQIVSVGFRGGHGGCRQTLITHSPTSPPPGSSCTTGTELDELATLRSAVARGRGDHIGMRRVSMGKALGAQQTRQKGVRCSPCSPIGPRPTNLGQFRGCPTRACCGHSACGAAEDFFPLAPKGVRTHHLQTMPLSCLPDCQPIARPGGSLAARWQFSVGGTRAWLALQCVACQCVCLCPMVCRSTGLQVYRSVGLCESV